MSNPGLVQQRLLLLVFVLSGFAGLIYQAVWSHYLGLFLGHAAYSQALVLAIFMGGMALGAAWVAHAGDRWRNLIRLYAIIELVIGVLGLLFHLVFVGMLGLSYDVLIPALGAPWLVNGYKWVLAALLILPQTVLLGMTFPLMSGGLIRRYPGADGNLLGGLYFTNSIGAAMGALAAGFLLLPALGMPGAMVVAGVVNLLVGIIAWTLSADAGKRADEVQGPGMPVEPGSFIAPDLAARPAVTVKVGAPLMKLVLLSTAMSGAASFVYEIVWIRMLSLAVGTTLHAFELMLASFIAGLAFGGLWIRKRADRTAIPVRLVGWMQVWMGMTALLSLVLYANAFGWVGWMMESFSRSDGGYTLFNIGTAAIAMLIMMPSAFFAGTTLPLFTVILLRDGQGERSIARVYAWNTLGSIVGVFLAIHLLIPGLGLKLALCLAAAVDMAIGLFLLRRGDAPAVHRRRPFVLGGTIAALGLFAAVALVPFDPMRLASGVYRTGQSQLPEGEEIMFYRDGKTASISVVASPGGTVRIATNGKVDASIQIFDDRPAQIDEPTMVLAAALPLAAHPNPRTAAVIGFGSGLTTHALLGDSRLQVVDTIEIEQAMVAGATAFGERVERGYLDPRSRIIIDDAKSFFSGQQARYDIIVSEPSNPWISGVGALFSEQFYDFIPRHLADDGLLLQWLQLYEINDTLVTSVLNALTPAFDDYVAYLSNQGDLLILASPNGPVPEMAFDRIMGGDIGGDLERIKLRSPEALSFRRVADARLLEGLGRLYAGRPNSDYHPILTLQAPKTRFQNASAESLIRLPVLEVQLLEWLGLRTPLPADHPMPDNTHFPAEMLTARARVQAALMRGHDVDVPDFLTASAVSGPAQITSLAQACEGGCSDAVARTFVDAILEVMPDQLVYIDAVGLRGIWIEPEWVDVDALAPPLQAAFELIAAHASRDAAAMEALGEQWLAHEGGRPWGLEKMDGLAFAGIQLAYVGSDRLRDIPALEARLGGKVPAVGDFELMRSILLAMADGEE